MMLVSPLQFPKWNLQRRDTTILSPWENFFLEVVSLVNLKFLLTSLQMTDFLSLGWNQTIECGWDQVQIFLAGIHGKYCECLLKEEAKQYHKPQGLFS